MNSRLAFWLGLLLAADGLPRSLSTPVCTNSFGFQPHPTDCQKYYQCAHGVPYEYTCHVGTLWSQAIKNCDWAANVECNLGGATSGPVATTPGPVVTTAAATTSGSGGATNGPIPATGCSGTLCGHSSTEPLTNEIRNLRDSTSCSLDNTLVEAITPGSPSNPSNVKTVEQVLPESKFDEFFPRKDAAYTYTNFLKAIGKYPTICKNAANCPKILAGMFAHFQQETAGLFYLEEINKHRYCETGAAWVRAGYPCAPGQKYYGRGAKQLSWNYNYGAFSNAIYGDASVLLKNPGLVASTWLNFASSMWFYVTPQSPKPSMLQVVEGTWTPNAADKAANLEPGFGATTAIINGGIECGGSPANWNGAANRAKYYREFAGKLGVNIAGEKLTCSDGGRVWPSGSSGSVALYWAPNSGCTLTKWQTAYSALVEGNYNACKGLPASDCSAVATTAGPVATTTGSMVTTTEVAPTNLPTVNPTGTECPESEANAAMKVVCYYPNWPYYRQGDGKYTVEDIEPGLCTHIMYSFVVLDPSTHVMKIHDKWLDVDLGNLRKFTDLKKDYPGVKFMLALGGWTDSRKAGLYSTLLASPTKRATFVTHAVSFLQQYGFDGLDLDYEYPVDVGNVQSDKPGFTALVRELRAAFDPKGWELTAAVSAGAKTVDAGYEVAELSQLLDAIHLMTYDMHGSWEKSVDHHGTLFGEPGDALTVDAAVKHWVLRGCPKSKLVVGIPTYGRSWTLSSSATSVGSPASGAGSPGPITRHKGFLAYSEICQKVQNGVFTKVTDPTNKMGPYAHGGRQWVGYDDPAMAGVKAQYILDEKLGGGMFWDLPSDDFRNKCGGGKYPIIRTVSDILKTGKACGTSAGPLPTTTPTPAITDAPTTTAVEGVSGNCEALLSGKSGWWGAFGAKFNLPVASSISSFELEFETNLPLTKVTFWNADVTPSSGKSFTATSKPWFGGKPAGGTLSLGFQVNFNGNTEPEFTSVKLNGIRLC